MDCTVSACVACSVSACATGAKAIVDAIATDAATPSFAVFVVEITSLFSFFLACFCKRVLCVML